MGVSLSDASSSTSVPASHFLKEGKWTLYQFACKFAAWFSSIFEVQNVLNCNDYTVQITGKVAESAELAFVVVS